MQVTLEKNGLVKNFNTGINLGYLFLGAWLPLFQGKIGKSFKHSMLFFLTLTIHYWIQAFGGYNKSIILDKIESGWSPVNESDRVKINNL